jgi:exosome complex exonuclease DIS3/RRP44
MASLSVWRPHSYYRQTRKGKILQSSNELYIRDDLGFGFTIPSHTSAKRNNVSVSITGSAQKISTPEDLLTLLIPEYSERTKKEKTRLVVVDTNVLLHNLDVLEHPSIAIANIVIPQTALLECRHRNFTAYNRVMDLIRSSVSKGDTQDGSKKNKRCAIFFPDTHHSATQIDSLDFKNENVSHNDENDAKIRQVAFYYGEALSGTDVDVILLTDDRGCREHALKEQQEVLVNEGDKIDGTKWKNQLLYHPKSVREHILELEKDDPGLSLSDTVAQLSTAASSHLNKVDLFDPHLSQNDLLVGIKSGRYFQGFIRSERGCVDRCYVTVRQGEERVAINIMGESDINRAVDGDVVAIELHPTEKWITNSEPTPSERNTIERGAFIAADTAEPTVKDENNVLDAIEINPLNICKPTGKVVGIVRRNFRKDYCGSIYSTRGAHKESLNQEDTIKDSLRDLIAKEFETEHPDGTTTCVFFAVDARIPPVLVRTSQRERLLGKRILIAIDSWPTESKYPLGHYVKTIGDTGGKDVETEVLLHEHNIPCDPFPAKVLACLPSEDYKIEMEEGRTDFRDLPILSIDPPGCKDIDDALHCTVLPNGNYQVGVHIADVTHYVKAGSAIDLEAANRSTSTYLVNKRLDMLPGLLTTDLCSLKGGVDRFAFSVLWEVTPNADIINVEFKKSIIHSIAALTYQQAQVMIDQPEDENDVQACAVKRLASLARLFRAKRIEAGALTLASPEVKFVLDSESLNPTDVQSYQLFEANALVEEFMLLANVTVGKKILRHYPTLSILRRHPAPNRSMFDSLISKAKSKGFSINIEDSKHLADSLDNAIIEDDPYFNKLLRILSTRCMSPAQYFCSGEYKPTEWHHYGLAAPVYTHFTSPIRRYADVCVHRLLAAAIGVEPLPIHLSSKSYLHDLASNMNRRHRAAQLAGRASVQLHTLLVFSGDQAGKDEDAYVLDVETDESKDPSLSVIVPRYGIEGRVRISGIDVSDKNLTRNADKHCITYKDPVTHKEATIQVFDKVRVKIFVHAVQDTQRELVLELLNPVFTSDNKNKTPLLNTTTTKRSKRESKGNEKAEKKKKIKR